MNDDLKAFDWTPVLELLQTEGRALMRLTNTTNGLKIDVIDREKSHCPTCQCNRTHAELPAHPMHPEIKRTKSWHHD